MGWFNALKPQPIRWGLLSFQATTGLQPIQSGRVSESRILAQATSSKTLAFVLYKADHIYVVIAAKTIRGEPDTHTINGSYRSKVMASVDHFSQFIPPDDFH